MNFSFTLTYLAFLQQIFTEFAVFDKFIWLCLTAYAHTFSINSKNVKLWTLTL